MPTKTGFEPASLNSTTAVKSKPTKAKAKPEKSKAVKANRAPASVADKLIKEREGRTTDLAMAAYDILDRLGNHAEKDQLEAVHATSAEESILRESGIKFSNRFELCRAARKQAAIYKVRVELGSKDALKNAEAALENAKAAEQSARASLEDITVAPKDGESVLVAQAENIAGLLDEMRNRREAAELNLRNQESRYKYLCENAPEPVRKSVAENTRESKRTWPGRKRFNELRCLIDGCSKSFGGHRRQDLKVSFVQGHYDAFLESFAPELDCGYEARKRSLVEAQTKFMEFVQRINNSEMPKWKKEFEGLKKEKEAILADAKKPLDDWIATGNLTP